jgi:hypothetical protein
MLRTPHCLDNRLTDGRKYFSLTRRPPLYSPERFFGIHFCYMLGKLQGLVRLQGLGKVIKVVHLIESRTRDLPTCSTCGLLSFHADLSLVR